eukprot:EG_transcript_15795
MVDLGQHGDPLPVALSEPAHELSRRRLLQWPAALLAAHALPLGAGAAEEATPAAAARPPQVFFDLTLDGEPEGRIVVEVFPDVGLGAQRFLDLAANTGGVGYRRSKVDFIANSFVRVGEVPQLSISEAERSPIAGGASTAKLEAALGTAARRHDGPGVVSLLVRSSTPQVFQEKLVARNGQMVTVRKPVGPAPPNGTAFCITTEAAPGLDATNLVVGRVVAGLDLVERLAKLPSVADNHGSPFFILAKAVGDKRADVAERGFGRPFAKVVVTRSGVL